jgi:TRAP-type C4-dicarboxylate transport system permease small subunit
MEHHDGSTPHHERRIGPRRSERGEGVISTAIAVLIVAFLGIALWTGFDSMMNSATERTRTQVEQIGG